MYADTFLLNNSTCLNNFYYHYGLITTDIMKECNWEYNKTENITLLRNEKIDMKKYYQLCVTII